jgi:D-alanyl-lipoteichoic acid acyltransferase DltB (MBOAT superfamily)
MLLLHGLRWIDPNRVLGIVSIPQLPGSLLLLVVIFSLPVIISYFRKDDSSLVLWGLFSFLLVLFLILKTPALTTFASQAWRTLAGQSPNLATASELSWLGFSYLAFRLLHTIRDKQAGRLPEIALNEYITYLVFFPAFVAGPIARADQFTTSLNEITDSFSDDLIGGSKRILIGLFKKFVLADSLSLIALGGQNALQPTSAGGGWILLYSFSFQIFFDFSGYTDIAIGMAQFFNIKLPENFNRPYRKPNLTQFWSNWHMTLTNWFRSYFFNPLSRSLRKRKLPAFTILFVTQISTMVLVGLWHGVTLNFVFWGLWHGLGLLIQNRWTSWAKKRFAPFEKEWQQQISRVMGIFITFHYVTLGWIWFVLPTPDIAWKFLTILLGASA